MQKLLQPCLVIILLKGAVPFCLMVRLILFFAHPWLLQLVSDLDCVFEKLDDLALDKEVLKHRYHLLFLSHPEGSSLDLTCAHFMHFDFHAARAVFQDKVVPSAAAGPSVSKVMHTCPISIAERECGLQFDSHMKLMAHIRFAHNGRNLLDVLTVSSSCICLSEQVCF